MLAYSMRYYIGIHAITSERQTTAVAVAAEASDKIPEKYAKREPWEIRRLLPASAQVTHPDPATAARAALQRLYERMFIARFIPNPETCIPPVTIYVPKQLAEVEIPGRVRQLSNHWAIKLASKVMR
jgi:hypothetical protein